jgi:hypothetical protein
MTASVRGEQLRGDLAAFRERTRRGAYSSALQGRAVAYAGDRVRNGAGPAEIAAELGVRELTVSRWIEKAGAASPSSTASAPRTSGVPAPVAMVPLMVRPEPETGAGARLDISFPDGTKVQVVGMAGRDLVEALTALRGAR